MPSWWAFVLLALAAYRTTRLVGWDVITRPLRESATGREEHGDAKEARDTSESQFPRPTMQEIGKPPAGERPERPAWQHHVDVFFHCPFCLGWWLSLAWYGLWLFDDTVALALATPFALSAVVGLTTKNLDA